MTEMTAAGGRGAGVARPELIGPLDTVTDRAASRISPKYTGVLACLRAVPSLAARCRGRNGRIRTG
jgi:hypothetical protein